MRNRLLVLWPRLFILAIALGSLGAKLGNAGTTVAPWAS